MHVLKSGVCIRAITDVFFSFFRAIQSHIFNLPVMASTGERAFFSQISTVSRNFAVDLTVEMARLRGAGAGGVMELLRDAVTCPSSADRLKYAAFVVASVSASLLLFFTGASIANASSRASFDVGMDEAIAAIRNTNDTHNAHFLEAAVGLIDFAKIFGSRILF